ncbi:hypothetical protein H2201_002996 [Coniosporium apollinis]|uniref:Nodulin-like domain-containing protein n=1 Tax=Coniosporium apollinis TaxID=61459 RepID=A0ABQ9P3B0_9PEZI|nr:hypothetical protein H2201_002996 [Coniosporium apollinis]
MSDRTHRTARIITSIAVTFISLACGTNYAYSAWAPQFAERMQLSATQSNLIGAAGNVGMYASGIPAGLLIDKRGPRPAILLGAIALGAGYFPLKKAYDDGARSMNIPLLCFLSFLTGAGSCAAFSASLKISALNWPHHRGTATAFPLSAFGLSAFFFTTLSGFVFPDNISGFLLLLSLGSFCLAFVPLIFIRILPPTTQYSALPTSEDRRPSLSRRDSNQLHRTKSVQSTYSNEDTQPESDHEAVDTSEGDPDESSSLMSGPGDVSPEENAGNQETRHSQKPGVTGLALLPRVEFWQLFLMLGLLTGVGLMTINNIGNDAQALWTHYDDSVSKSFILKRQLLHVSIISFMSFLGRLASGVGSDILVKHLHMSRFWCLAASASVFTAAQLCAIKIENPNHLWAVSSLTGFAYGALFGVYPALVADTFGVQGLSLNWGFMTLAPVISGNVFNLCYGRIYDHHSTVLPGGERDCPEGLRCYAAAYWVTCASSVLGILVSLWCIRHQHVVKTREGRHDHPA